MLFGSDNEANFQASLKFIWRAKDYKKVKYGLYIQIYRRIYTFFFLLHLVSDHFFFV